MAEAITNNIYFSFTMPQMLAELGIENIENSVISLEEYEHFDLKTKELVKDYFDRKRVLKINKFL